MSRNLLKSQRSDCPIASALDVVGDKWTLLLIRDIGLFGKHRNKEFQEAGEGIPSNILANRLKQLVEQGLLEKRLYRERPPRYEYHLTRAGKGLLPVVRAMARWGTGNIRGVRIPEKLRK
ncbi:MAG: helix-turn-helix domain-containing protein [Woeseiaceae bacterium]|nr:helix-turn-helix domain-containing protein [Woeseiaceae bacterium]